MPEQHNGLRLDDDPTLPAVTPAVAVALTSFPPITNQPTLELKQPGADSLALITPAELEAEKTAATLAARSAETTLSSRMQATPLVAEIHARLMAARQAKQFRVDLELLEDLRQREGEYEPDVLAMIMAKGGSRIFDNITEQVCSAIKASIAKVFLYQGADLPWGFAPSELPDLPPDAIAKVSEHVQIEVREFMQSMGLHQPSDFTPEHSAALRDRLTGRIAELEEELQEAIDQEAQDRADRLEKKMAVIFDKADFSEQFGLFLDDFATYRAAHLIGPVPTYQPVETWNQATGRMEMKRELVLKIKRVNPFDVFPDAASVLPNDGGLRVRWLYSRKDLSDLLPPDGTENFTGVIVDELKALLANWSAEAKGPSTIMTSDAARGMIELRYNHVQSYYGRAEGFQFWEPLDGKRINEFYTSFNRPELAQYDDLLTYHMTGIIVGHRIIQLVENFDKTGDIPTRKASYRRRAGAYWGKSPPSLMREEQTAVNSLRRSSLTNSMYSARPDRVYDKQRLINPTISDEPGQKYYIKDNAGHSLKAVEWLDTPLRAVELDALRDKAQMRSFNKTGVQPYNLGDGNTPASMETLGAFKLLVDMQSDIIKDAIFQIDCHVVRPMVRSFWRWLMEYDPDPLIKGDIHIFARGALELYIKEQDAQRRLDWLRITNNPLDQGIIGLKGRAEQLRKAAHSTGVGDGGVPTDEELREQGTIPSGGGASGVSGGAQDTAQDTPIEQPAQDNQANAALAIQAQVAAAKIDRERADAKLKQQLAIKAAIDGQVKKALAVMQINNVSLGSPRGGRYGLAMA